MSEQKKLTTAEILAMARKGTAGGGAKSEPKSEAAASEPAATEPSAEPAAAKPAAEKPAKTAAKPAAGGRPSVADILAAARAGGAQPAATKPAEPAAEKPKPAPKAKPEPKAKPAVAEDAEAKVGGPRDTASILAAARKASKPGPVSKETATKEAAAKQASPDQHAPAHAPAAKSAGKTKPTVPPMPAKPASAMPKAAKGADEEDRRGFMGFMLGTFLGLGFSSLAATFSLWGLGTARFMFPNILTEPPSQFKVGFPADFPPGSVADKFKAQFGVWVANNEYNGVQQIYALRTVCTHLGCTPNWLEGEQKFKCPCHGSGFYKDGINFEGPAPRPLERYAIRVADDGQLEIDKSKLFFQEKGEWADPGCFVAV